MKTITLHKKDIYNGHLILINNDYPLNLEYRFSLKQEKTIVLEETTALFLEGAFNKLNYDNNISYVSGYRTQQEQTQIYKDCLVKNGEFFTKQYVAIPGHSEHQSGLAVDLALTSNNINFITPCFPYNGICQKFRDLALQYGFIERYQKEKEDITKISAEPWHFRYVGIPHSTLMADNHWCLEEYIEEIKFYTINQPLQYVLKDCLFSIFYVSMYDESLTLSLNEEMTYQISGNNIDGFIITSRKSYV